MNKITKVSSKNHKKISSITQKNCQTSSFKLDDKFIVFLIDENCQFLLELSDEYQMEWVKELCCEYLSDNVQDTNCVKFYMIADMFGLDAVGPERNTPREQVFTFELFGEGRVFQGASR